MKEEERERRTYCTFILWADLCFRDHEQRSAVGRWKIVSLQGDFRRFDLHESLRVELNEKESQFECEKSPTAAEQWSNRERYMAPF